MTETSEEVWFVLLQGEELGPLSFEEVLDFYYKDVVSSETLIWREGHANWSPIIHVQEFNELLFQGVMITPQQPSQPLGEDTAFIEQDSLNHVVPVDQSRMNFPISSTHESIDERIEDLELLEDIEFLEPLDSILETPPISRSDPYENASMRIDTSPQAKKSSGMKWLMVLLLGLIGGGALFIKLEADKVSLTSATPQSLITKNVAIKADISSQTAPNDIPATPSDIPATPSDIPATPSDIPATPSDIPATPSAPPAMPSASSAMPNTNSPTPNPPSAKDFPAPSETATNDPPLRLPRAQLAEEVNQGGTLATADEETGQAGIEEINTLEVDIDIEEPLEVEQTLAKAKTSTTTKKSKTSGRRKKSRTIASSKSPSKTRTSKRNKSKSRAKPTKAPASKSKVPETLRRDDFEKVLKKKKKSFQKCLSKDKTLTGTISVMAVIQRNGVVTSAQPTSAKLRKSPASDCVISVVKSSKFPEYSGRLLRVPLPIKL